MTVKEAKQLLKQTVVMWDNDPNDLGTVRDLSPTAVYIDWENGQRGWIDHNDMKRVSVR